MDPRRAAPTLGVVACVGYVLLLLVPYPIADDPGGVSTYYTAGTLTPWAGGLLALVAIVVFAAGREDRTAPETAAGAGLGFGVVVLLITLLWAVTLPAEVPLQLTTDEPLVGELLTTGTVLAYHRWVLAAVGALPAAAGAWYARSLGLL